MTDKHTASEEISERALEMIMRDVLDGMLDWSVGSALSGPCCEFEIIDIEPARQRRLATASPLPAERVSNDTRSGEIIDFPAKRRAWG